VEGQKTYPDLTFAKRVGDGSTILGVSRINIRRIIFNPSTTALCFDLKVLLISVQKGTVQTADKALKMCLTISSEGDYKFCSRLD